MTTCKIAAFYKFVPLENFQALQKPLFESLNRLGIKGTILLAHEGINGTLAGTPENLDRAVVALRSHAAFSDLDHKESFSDKVPFARLKVRLKSEIVSMGEPDLLEKKGFGRYLNSREWNQFLSSPDTLVIDTRNSYECAIGHFKGAIDPKIKSFRDFPSYVNEHHGKDKTKKVALYCTGGIRCEKASVWMSAAGFEEVYQLNGGILKYFDDMSSADSLFEGECFVFDDRVSVDSDLKPGQYDMCHACRHPITEMDKQSPLYEKGVSCPNCSGSRDEADLARFRERERQLELARRCI